MRWKVTGDMMNELIDWLVGRLSRWFDAMLLEDMPTLMARAMYLYPFFDAFD